MCSWFSWLLFGIGTNNARTSTSSFSQQRTIKRDIKCLAHQVFYHRNIIVVQSSVLPSTWLQISHTSSLVIHCCLLFRYVSYLKVFKRCQLLQGETDKFRIVFTFVMCSVTKQSIHSGNSKTTKSSTESPLWHSVSFYMFLLVSMCFDHLQYDTVYFFYKTFD